MPPALGGPTGTAVVPAAPFQADRTPSSPAKMNRAFALVPGTVNAGVSLKTCPVGAPPGMLTTSPCFVTGEPGVSVRYSVVLSLPLFGTQIGVFGPCDIPHGFTRSGSAGPATPGWSDTRFTCWNVVP